MFDGRPTYAEINLAALQHNYQLIRNSIAADTDILAVVKADAYGHGFMDISRELERLGVNAFGVAFLAEGIQLRKSGCDKPILLLGGIYPGQERKCIGFNISTAVFNIEQARALNQAAGGRLFRQAAIHIKIDTGMGRLGVPFSDVPGFLAELKQLKNITVEGVISHFASADELDENGRSYTNLQRQRFTEALAEVYAAGFTPRYVHIANSAAAMTQEMAGCNLIRPGIALYGALPSDDFYGRLDLTPVMSLKSRVAMLKWVEPGTSISYARRFTACRRALIASIPVGYADGYPRALTNCGEALVRGKRAAVAGTVCMDWTMLDVTEIEGISVGDSVTLMGMDSSGAAVSAEEIAAWAGTIPYAIFCGISKRVPRMYV